MAVINSLDIGNGALNLDSMYAELETYESQSLTPITQQATTVKSQLSAFGQLRSALASLQKATTVLNSTSALNSTSIISSNQSFTATSNSNASVGSYQITVKQLATSQTLLSNAISSNNQPLGSAGAQGRTLTLQTGDGGTAPERV